MAKNSQEHNDVIEKSRRNRFTACQVSQRNNDDYILSAVGPFWSVWSLCGRNESRGRGEQMERGMWFGVGKDLSLRRVCQSSLWQQDLQLLLAACTCRHVRSSWPYIESSPIEAAIILISSGFFGKLTVTWMLKLWARKCFKGRRENKTCEVAVIFLEISWAV